MASIWIATFISDSTRSSPSKTAQPEKQEKLSSGPEITPNFRPFSTCWAKILTRIYIVWPGNTARSWASASAPHPPSLSRPPPSQSSSSKRTTSFFASRLESQANKLVCYGQRSLIFGKYGPYWRDMRKLCTLELLSNLRISQFQAMRRAELGILVRSLKRAAKSGETVDLSARVSGLSGDMNCLMIFGKKYADSDLDERGFKDVITETTEIGGKFNLADYFPYIEVLDLQGLNRRMKELSRIFDRFLEKIIDEHVKNKKAGKNDGTEDFVDTMMSIMESGEAGFEFDRRNVKAVLQDLLIAGMDTSSTAVEWALSELFRHPQIMKKLQNELESVVGLDHMVEEQHLHTLEYLDAVIKESLRLHPVAPLLIPHESMEDCVIDGFHIPKKSRILVNTWAIGRDPNVWPDPETFSPERFIGSHIDLKGQHFQLLPFGSGTRGCPGLQLGLTVVKLLVAQLVSSNTR
ncbi:cytochrome p450 cyp736a12 [Phtheirospermum japonicum]|uniref:Cytochrome p450 cyp736a12 n=1 Tax=Phtheirospermum japonicum TaxID=374723 RepID=A0A830BB74_9LAMI|nr:cytochrome p450 cyp736a12 [Phtheirospermum japonicum]